VGWFFLRSGFLVSEGSEGDFFDTHCCLYLRDVQLGIFLGVSQKSVAGLAGGFKEIQEGGDQFVR